MSFRNESWDIDPLEATRVVYYDEGRPFTRADCSDNALPDREQERNARAVAKMPDWYRLLIETREFLLTGQREVLLLTRANLLRDINNALKGAE